MLACSLLFGPFLRQCHSSSLVESRTSLEEDGFSSQLRPAVLLEAGAHMDVLKSKADFSSGIIACTAKQIDTLVGANVMLGLAAGVQ